MKNKFTIISILFSYSIIMAAPVTLEKAQRVSGNIFVERSNTGTIDNYNVRSVDILNENAVDLIYVFQLESKGFILVSADDRVPPMLAYSFESTFFIEDVPSNVSWMIDAYKKMVRNAIESDESATEKVNAQWEKYFTGNGLNTQNRDIVEPLLTSNWNQSGGWNSYCPGGTTCSSDQVPSGCVAVSMSAIMHYWQYPVTGEGENSCYCGGYGTQYAEFSNAFYDYGAMGNAVSASDAAAFLAWHAGIAVNMNYDCEGSGAGVTGGYPSTEYAMKNYFLYKSSIYDTAPYSWSDAQWIDKLANELDNNRPFIYVGYNDEGGHAWNCDGYDGDLFHMNWGWGGSENGWFTVTDATDPNGWGDGSHVLINIEPESLNRPNLKLTSYSSYETSGDGDAVINPGETFEIIIELENPIPWAAASSIELLLTTEDEGVIIDESTSSIISFETLEPGATFSNASMPFIIDADGDIELGKKVFNLMVMGVGIEGAEDNFYFKEYELEVLVSLNQYGFPLYEASQKTSPLAIDFDNNGEDEEIIYGDYNGYIHILNSDGSEIVDENFPFNTGNQVWGAAAGADMDNDGLIDIAVLSKSKHFYLLDQNGLKLDFDADKYLLGTPAIGNLDSDADLEVVFSGFSSGNMIWALNTDGSAVNGFPIDLGEKVKIGVALADFNGNGRDDIVVGTDSDYIHLFYDDGSEAPGFPYQAGDKIQSAPAILDVAGQKVIFVGSNDNNLYAINSDGSLRFSITTTDDVFNSPAFLEHNNNFYVFFSDDSGILYAVDTDGNALSGWPVDAVDKISKSVVFADLDNDGEAEIIAVTDLPEVLAFNLDGSFHDGFPMENEFSFKAAPMVMDMDGDGDLEILASSVNSLVALDIKSAGSSNGYWSMYRGNTFRTGYYDLGDESECPELGDMNGDSGWNILDIVLLANCVLDDNCNFAANGCAGDLNGDSGWNILDIVILANCVLDDNCSG